MGWKERVHGLIRLGRIHHPDAVEAFLESIQKPYWDGMRLHEAVSALPELCEGMAMSIVRAARLEDVQDEEILRVIKAAAHETRDVKPLPPVQANPNQDYNDIMRYYESFGDAQVAGNPF